MKPKSPKRGSATTIMVGYLLAPFITSIVPDLVDGVEQRPDLLDVGSNDLGWL